MPKYYFQIDDGRGFVDRDGEELPDANAARAFAVRHAAEVLTLDAAHIEPGKEWTLNVTDSAGLILFRLDVTLAQFG